MSTGRYFVSASASVKAEFQNMMARARTRGQFAEAVKASEWILEELARTPQEFGESRDYLASLNLQIRIAFVRPLAVHFAVNEEKGIVFVLRFNLSKS